MSQQTFRLIATKSQMKDAVEFFAGNYSVLQMIQSPNMTATRGDMFLCTMYMCSRLELLIKLLSDHPEEDLMSLPQPFEMMHNGLNALIQSVRDEGIQLRIHEDGVAEFIVPPPETETDLDTLSDLDGHEEETQINDDDLDEVEEDVKKTKRKRKKARKKRKKTTTKKKTRARRKSK